MSIFSQYNSIMVVGGTGDKSGRSSVNGGGCTKDYVGLHGGEDNFNLNLIMDSNGGPLYTDESGSAVYAEESGVITLSSAEGLREDMIGVAVYVVGVGGGPFAVGRYDIKAVDTQTPSITIQNGMTGMQEGLAYVKVYIGGAIDSLTCALDAVDATKNHVDIYSNLSETFSNYTLSKGGNIAANSWLRVTAFNASLTDMLIGGVNYQSAYDAFKMGIDLDCCVVLDGGDSSENILSLYNADNVMFRSFYFTNNRAIAIWADVSQSSNNTCLQHCKFSKVGRGVQHGGGERPCVYDCYFHDDITVVHAYFYFNHSHIESSVLNGNDSITNIMLLGNGCAINCLILNGYHGINVSAYSSIINCTIYNQSDCCIYLKGDSVSLLSRNNLLMPKTSLLPAIEVSTSGGAYSGGNNCFYGVDGTALVNAFVNNYTGGLSEVPGDNSLECDPLLSNVAEKDFRPTQQALIKGGKPMLDVVCSIGAVLPEYKIQLNNRTANFGRLSIIRS